MIIPYIMENKKCLKPHETTNQKNMMLNQATNGGRDQHHLIDIDLWGFSLNAGQMNYRVTGWGPKVMFVGLF